MSIAVSAVSKCNGAHPTFRPYGRACRPRHPNYGPIPRGGSGLGTQTLQNYSNAMNVRPPVRAFRCILKPNISASGLHHIADGGT
eukprot:161998-Prymnesium_polylepis.1